MHVLSLLIDANFEILISAYLQLKYDPFIHQFGNESGDVASKVTTYVNVFLILVVFPVIFAFAFFQPMSRYKNIEFAERWGVLFEGLKLRTKFDLTYFLLFVVRRFLFIVIAFFMENNTFQMIFLF